MLHGPPHVESHITTARSFAQLRSLQLVKRDICAGDFVDSGLRVEGVPIYPATAAAAGPDSSSQHSVSKKQRMSLNSCQSDMSLVYICQPHPKPRSLSLEKCVDHGVPAGPLMGRLKDGQVVQLTNGKLVKPDDVLEPAEPSLPFIVVECPSMEYLSSLVTNTRLQQFQQKKLATSHCNQSISSDETVGNTVSLDAHITEAEVAGDRSQMSTSCQDTVTPCIVVHMTPSHIMTCDLYQLWMSRFGERTCHLVLNDLGSDLVLQAVHNIQNKLHLLHPNIFPTLPCQPTQRSAVSTGSVVYGQTNLKYVYRGKNRGTFCHEQCAKLDSDEVVQETTKNAEFVETLSQLHQQITDISGAADSAAIHPEMLFLGTGSALPNKVRNVSAVWLNLSGDVSMLLDCGENTLGQLYRHYGTANMTDVLRRLQAVYVSHLHADHHLGVIGLALERYRLLQLSGIQQIDPLIVIAGQPLADWYSKLHSQLIPVQSLIRLMPIQFLYRGSCNKQYFQLIEKLGLDQLNATPVYHTQHAHGVVLVHKNWKLAYSGDTMPCQEFIDLVGDGCNVIIHEATMDDDLVEDAAEKRHSTTSQAIEVGLKMKAEFIILTHFSQRYAKVPLFNDNFTSRVGIAFDNMRVRLCDLPLLPLFTPALKQLFAEDYADMEERTDRKRLRKQLVK